MRKARTRRRKLAPAVILVALGLLLAACGEAPQSALDPQGPFAQKPDDLWKLVFGIGVVVFVLVQGLIIYTMVKFRERPGDDSLPVQVHGNTKLEVMWTLIPALILAGIAVPTVQMIFDLAEKPDEAITVEVIGHRWWWEYRYPEHGDIVTANEIVIPAGVPVRLEMVAEEGGVVDRGVIHSFWIPPLGGKQDVVPGRTTTLNIQADNPGRYLGQCAEYCGLSHANMRARAVALSPAEFDQWVADQQQAAATPAAGSLEAKGMELFGDLGNSPQSCVACHAITTEDGPMGARVGPDLTHLMSRKEFAGAILDLYERDGNGDFTDQPNVELLKDWLRDPNALKPMQPETGIGMPNLGLNEDEIDALVAYLLTLK